MTRGAEYALWSHTQPKRRPFVSTDKVSLGFSRRSSREKPPIALVESALMPRLLKLDDDAIRVYVTLARFANRHTGHAYPKLRILRRQLNFVPFHTDRLSGRTRVGLTRVQLARRESRNGKANDRVQEALDALERAGLLKRTVRHNSYGPYPVRVFLRNSGKPRKLPRLQRANSFFVVPSEAILDGAFGLWPGPRNTLVPLSGVALRLYLLAVRDNNGLRYGGIDPERAIVWGKIVGFPDMMWPRELGCSFFDCWEALGALRDRGLIYDRLIIASQVDKHIIRFGNEPTGSDEECLRIFAVSGGR